MCICSLQFVERSFNLTIKINNIIYLLKTFSMFNKSAFKYTILVSCFLSSCNTSNPSKKDIEVEFNGTVKNETAVAASDPIPVEIDNMDVVGKSIITKVGHAINTSSYEFLPILNSNANKLYFTGMDRTGFFDFKQSFVDSKTAGGEDVFVSIKENNIWKDARPVAFLNTNGHESVSFVNKNEDLIITANYDENLGLKTGSKGTETTDMFFAKKMGENYKIEHFLEPVNSLYFEADGIFDKEEKYLLFASDRPNGIGEYHKKGWQWENNLWGNTDIYVAEKTDYGWVKVANLGNIVNTEHAERFPWLSDDGMTLYISSNAYSDSADMNIYAFKRNDKSDWQQWEGPYQLKSLNTDLDEIGFKIYPDSSIFFSRAANLDFNPTQGGRGGDGGFRQTNYRSGYELYGCQVSSLYRTQLMDIFTVSKAKNAIYTFEDICFDLNSFELKELYNADLEEVIDYLSMNSSLTIEVVGFTDDIGGSDYNKQLSLKRAESISNRLKELGMTNKVVVIGKGEESPKYSNESKQKSKNRRVEIFFGS